MPEGKFSFQLQNNLAELDKLYQQLKQFGESVGISKKCLFEINLALDELFTNSVNYGFKDNREHRIVFTLWCENQRINIRIEDDGIQFDPVQAAAPKTHPMVEKCEIGGLGIHLTKKIMDHISYQRCNNRNIVTIKKRISGRDEEEN